MNFLAKTIIIYLYIQIPIFSQPSWQVIKTPTDFNLLKVHYLDSLHCWVAGDSGTILFSSDGGYNWQFQNSGVSNFISDIFFFDELYGWALTFEIEGINFDTRAKILRTTDGGYNWEKINYRHLNVFLSSVFFKDSLNGWIGTYGNGIIYTEDGGYNWNQSTIIDTGGFANFPIEEIAFSNSNFGFAVGGRVDNAGVTWYSTDGGYNWIPTGVGPDLILDYVFTDSINIVSLTAELEGFYPTSILNFNLNNGFWTYDSLNFYAYVSGMSMRKQNEIWCSSSRLHQGFVFTDNLFIDWQLINAPDSLYPSDVAFADSLHGIATSLRGNILRYIPQNSVSVEKISQIIPDEILLEQNYPNPFNPVTKIRWHSPKDGYQTLKVFDVLGNEIVTLVNEYLPAGVNEIEFNIVNFDNQLTSGIYFYQFKSGDKLVSKKMILLK